MLQTGGEVLQGDVGIIAEYDMYMYKFAEEGEGNERDTMTLIMLMTLMVEQCFWDSSMV